MIDNTNPNNYVSKGAALGTSIPALALAAIPYLTGGNGLGGLGGLFGGGNAAVLAGGTAAGKSSRLQKQHHAHGVEHAAERYKRVFN